MLLPRSRSLPYVVPFALFMALLALMPHLGVALRLEQVIRLTLVGATLLLFSRPVLDLRVHRGLGSVLVGVGVFVVWIGPDLLWKGYHELPLFRNWFIGEVGNGFPDAGREDPIAISLRFLRAAVLVPIIEELFWRAWLPRRISSADFERVPLGAYTPVAFWITAVLFAVEHGAYWDVGLLAGIAYNWWMRTTKSLGDCVLAHAVTNACLSAYVVAAGRWEYW